MTLRIISSLNHVNKTQEAGREGHLWPQWHRWVWWGQQALNWSRWKSKHLGEGFLTHVQSEAKVQPWHSNGFFPPPTKWGTCLQQLFGSRLFCKEVFTSTSERSYIQLVVLLQVAQQWSIAKVKYQTKCSSWVLMEEESLLNIAQAFNEDILKAICRHSLLNEQIWSPVGTKWLIVLC